MNQPPHSSDSAARSAATPTQAPPIATWWLAIDGQTIGPHSEAYIASHIGRDGIGAITPACSDEDRNWKRLQDWPQFSGLFQQPAVTSSADKPSPIGIWLWNPELPMPARLIGIYLLLIHPALTLLFLVANCGTGTSDTLTQDHFDLILLTAQSELQSVALSIFAVVTAVQLLRLNRLAVHGAAIYFAISLTCAFILLITFVGTMAYAVTLPQDVTSSQTHSADAAVRDILLGCATIPVFISLICFEIYSLAWWIKNARTLPWRLPHLRRIAVEEQSP